MVKSIFLDTISHFGGNKKIDNINSNKSNKSNKTTIIIVVVIVIIVIVLLAGGGYYMYKSKEEKTKPNVTNKQYDNLKCETTNVKTMPFECLKKIWSDLGCTQVDYMYNEMINDNPDKNIFKEMINMETKEPLKYKELYEKQKTYLNSNSFKEKCFGADKSKWPASPCNKYDKNSQNIDIECLSELYSIKCPNFDIKKVDPTYLEKNKNETLQGIQGSLMFLQPETCNLLYGPNQNR